MSDCRTPAQLDAYVADGEQDAAICAHLAQCESCRQRLREIREEHAFLRDFVRTASANGDLDLAAAPDVVFEDDVAPGYRVRRVLGRGGQAVVYEAEQLRTRRRVALKVLGVGCRWRERRLRRFEREIELVAGLRHPHIVTIYDSGLTRDGQPYFAMEYIEDVPINEFCRRDGFGDPRTHIRRTLSLFADVCDAVRHAHQQGIIHRDIKPSNILVDADGRPRVLDFGLARVVTDSPSATELTTTGEFLGTLIYAAPEQVSGDVRAVDTRTDIYALGVVLYKMLTGVHPYPLDGSVAEVIRNIQHRPADRPSLHVPAIDDELETIVLKSLAKQPDRRYQSAAALLDDVRRYLAGEPISAKRDSAWYLLRAAARRYRGAVAAVLALVFALVAFSVTMAVLYRQKQRAEIAVRRTAAELARTVSLANVERGRLMNLTGNAVLAERLLWGELLADPPQSPVRDARGVWRLPVSPAWWGLWEVYHTNPCRATVQAHAAGVVALGFDPDTRQVISVGGDGSVVVWDTAEDHVCPIGTLPAPDSRVVIAVTPDGRSILWLSPQATQLWRVEDRRLMQVLALELPRERVKSAAISDNGQRFGVITTGGRAQIADVLVGGWTHTLPTDEPVIAMAFAPNAATLWLLTRGEAGASLHGFDASSGRPVATLPVGTDGIGPLRISSGGRLAVWQSDRKLTVAGLEPLAPPVWLSGHLDLWHGLALDHSGSLAATGGADRSVRIWDLAQRRALRVLYGHEQHISVVAFSPKATRLVSGDASGVLKLWDTRDATPRRLRTAFAVHNLASSPARGTVTLVGADFATRRGVLEQRDATDWQPRASRTTDQDVIPAAAFIPGADRIATCSTGGTVCLWSLNGREVVRRSGMPSLAHIAVSPDGRTLVASENDLPGRVWVLDAATLDVLATLDAHRARTPSVAFSPDGSQFASASMDSTVVLWNAHTLCPRVTIRTHDAGVRVVRFSPDGALLATGCDDWSVRLFDARRGQLQHTLTGHRQHVFALAFSPDGRLLASGDRGGVVRLWDVATGRNLLHLADNLPGHVMDLRFDSTGHDLIVAMNVGLVVWDLTAHAPHIAANRSYWQSSAIAVPR